ncbi:hypothetical protein D915_000981 [Fasciola hepatica]|uniref:Uncharacterized protein n=1 Tax=Fasciola hepatica TaxID=6192 RepID=A0A4E0RQR4_FASHE|nr:hypothetical protein D915_000981 [Fasciola hepatica]
MTQGISTFRFPADTQLSAVLERAVQRRQLPRHGGYQYHLESWPHSTDQHTQQTLSSSGRNKPGDFSDSQMPKGQRLDLNLRLTEVVATQLPLRFVLVRDNSRCDPVMVDSGDEDEPAEGTVTPSAGLHATLQLRQYRVTLLGDVFSREVQLNVSKDGIKIDQIAPSFRRPKFFSRPAKPLLYPVDVLADCVLVPASSSSSSSPRGKGVEEHHDTCAQNNTSGDSRTRLFSTGKVQFRILYMAS